MSDNQAPHILLVGSHRSGTSWSGKILEAHGLKGVFEPFNPFRVAELNGYAKHPYHSHYLLSDQENDDYLEAYAARVMAGEAHTSWTMSRNRSAFRDEKRFIIKDIYIHTMLEWFLQRHPCQTALILRHPAGVLESMKKVERHFEPNPAHCFDSAVVRKWLTTDEIRSLQDELDHTYAKRAIIRWFLDNSVALRIVKERTTSRLWDGSEEQPTAYWFTYEDLCRDPEGEAKKLYEAVGLEFNDSAQKFLTKSTSRDTTSPFAVTREPMKHIHAWKGTIPQESLELIHRLAHVFGMQHILASMER